MIQHDTDQSIAAFQFQLVDQQAGYGAYFSPQSSEGEVRITRATTYFRNDGPTNFYIEDDFGHDHYQWLNVTFARSATGHVEYTASYWANLYVDVPPVVYSGTVGGTATRGTVDPALAQALDASGGYAHGVHRIVPTYIGPQDVPEPASALLLALGLAVMAATGRARKAT